MTVAHVYAGYVASGAEGITRNVRGLVDALASRGVVSQLRTSAVDLADLNRAGTHARNAWRARRLVREAFADPRVSVVHHHVNIAAMGRASRKRRGRVLLHVWNAIHRPSKAVRGIRGSWKHALFNGPRAARWGLGGHEEVVVSSRFQAAQIEALGFAGAIHIAPNGIDAKRFRPPTPAERARARAFLGLQDRPIVLYYGHLSPWKGVDDLLSAFASPALARRDAQLLVAHTDYGVGRARLRHAIGRLGLTSRVRLLGITEIPQLLHAADVVAVPPIAAVGSACHPNVLLEALSAGACVVATRVGSIPEATLDGKTAILAEPHDPASLGEALDRALSDPGLRSRLGRAARDDAVARFDWDVAAARFESIYGPETGPRPQARPVPQRRGQPRPAEVEAWA